MGKMALPGGFLEIETKTDAELSAAVQDLGSKHTNTDGMTADNQGRIWFTMLEHTGMGYYDPADGEMHEFVQDERMVWVDTPQISNDGCILFTTNQLHFLNTGRLDFSVPNERVWRAYVGEDFKNYLLMNMREKYKVIGDGNM